MMPYGSAPGCETNCANVPLVNPCCCRGEILGSATAKDHARVLRSLSTQIGQWVLRWLPVLPAVALAFLFIPPGAPGRPCQLIRFRHFQQRIACARLPVSLDRTPIGLLTLQPRLYVRARGDYRL